MVVLFVALLCRSAASAEELYLTSGLLLADSLQHSREQRVQQATEPQQPQHAKEPSGHSSTGAAPAATGGADSTCPGPPNIKTSVAENGAASAAAASASAADAGAGSSVQGSASAGVPSTARQLFGSLLPFGSSSGLVGSQQDKSQASGKAANGTASTSLYACGAVTSLSGSSTPTAAAGAGGSSHNGAAALAAAAAGSSAVPVTAGLAHGGSGHHSSHHFHRSSLTSTPQAATAAAASAAVSGTPSACGALRAGQHHRTSSGTSDAASRTPAGAWPASPPASGRATGSLYLYPLFTFYLVHLQSL